MGNSLFKLSSLNLNGIRSATSKGLEAWLSQVQPDCICVQEIKAQATDVAGRFEELAGLKGYFHFAEKKGYSGVGVYTRHEPSDVLVGYGSAEFDAEGRYLELRFDTPGNKLSLISCYFPSGSSGEERQQAKFRFLDEIYPHIVQLKAEREFILCGDVNIAHREIDLKNWRGNQKNSGFLPEERAWMTRLLNEAGMVDVYRKLQPTATDAAYTWWSNRGQAYAKNVGWRLDYHLATPALAALAHCESIYKGVKFSDHAPITIDYKGMSQSPQGVGATPSLNSARFMSSTAGQGRAK
jgi:exodeoxyribonuclease-3